MFASTIGNNELVSLLISHGANIEAITHSGVNALDLARKNGHISTSIMLEKSKSVTAFGGISHNKCKKCRKLKRIDVITLPCGDAVICQKCSDEMERKGDIHCLLCKTKIRAYVVQGTKSGISIK